jgi:hypothetical protein
VIAATASLGIGERSVWRWLAAGEYEPGKRSGWQMTPAWVAGARRTLKRYRVVLHGFLGDDGAGWVTRLAA